MAKVTAKVCGFEGCSNPDDSYECGTCKNGVCGAHIQGAVSGAGARPQQCVACRPCEPDCVGHWHLCRPRPGPPDFEGSREVVTHSVEPDLSTLAKRLVVARDACGISQRFAADAAWLPLWPHFLAIESGEAEPDDQQMAALAELYGVHKKWLRTGKGPRKALSLLERLERAEASLRSIQASTDSFSCDLPGSLGAYITRLHRIAKEGLGE